MSSLRPMLLGESTIAPSGDEWAVEVKNDGWRVLVHVADGKVRVETRNGMDITRQCPEMQALALGSVFQGVILDGEMTCLGPDGRPHLTLVQSRLQLQRPAAIALRSRHTPLVFHAFDVLRVAGKDTTGLPWAERRALLDGLGLNGPYWRTPSYCIGSAPELFDLACQAGIEGVVCKRVDSLYKPGTRSDSWIKIKNSGYRSK